MCSGSSRVQLEANIDPGGPLAPETDPLFAPRARIEPYIFRADPDHPLVLIPRRLWAVSKMMFDEDAVSNTISVVSKRILLISKTMLAHSSMKKKGFRME